LIKWEIYQIYAKFSKLKAEGFFLFGLLSHLSSADVKKRGHCSRARMQIKFCKLICTREENVHSIRLLLVHRKRCALKAIVQLAQNFYIQKHCLGFATPSHKIHICTTRQHKTQRSVADNHLVCNDFFHQMSRPIMHCGKRRKWFALFHISCRRLRFST